MTQVWKCDHCSQTGTQEEISKHELECSFNPAKKLCWTCTNRIEAGAPISGFWNECKKGKKCHEVEDEKVACELWESEQKFV